MKLQVKGTSKSYYFLVTKKRWKNRQVVHESFFNPNTIIVSITTVAHHDQPQGYINSFFYRFLKALLLSEIFFEFYLQLVLPRIQNFQVYAVQTIGKCIWQSKKESQHFYPCPPGNSPPPSQGSISKRNRTSQEIFHTNKQIRFREESEFDFDKLSWEQCFLLERYHSGMAPKHFSLNIWIWTLILHTNQLHRMMTLKSWQKPSCWRIHNLNCRKKKKRGS